MDLRGAYTPKNIADTQIIIINTYKTFLTCFFIYVSFLSYSALVQL